jgi:hypothetical protein
MPNKTINDYIFYKIVCLDDSVELCYVGSTANWKARNNCHKSSCNNETNKLYNSKLYTTIRENGGFVNFKMIQIGTREQLTKREAEQIEEQYRQELKANLNSKKCYLSQEDKREINKERKHLYYLDNIDKVLEYQKKYKEENKDKIKERAKQYREDNKDKIAENKKHYNLDNRDKIAEQRKQYHLNNRDKIAEQRKQHYKENRDKILERTSEKITCECGCEMRTDSLARHRKSKTHIDLMSTKIKLYNL